MAGIAALVLCGLFYADAARPQYRPIIFGEIDKIGNRRLTVFRGQAETLRYSREPGTVIVGNETVAAVSIAASDILVLTGLQPGETNVIVLDDEGIEIDRIAVRVVERGSDVVVSRGQSQQILRCAPACGPAGGAAIAPSALVISPDAQPLSVAPRGEDASLAED